MNGLVDWHGHQEMPTSHTSGFGMCSGRVTPEFESMLRNAAWRGRWKLSSSCWPLDQFYLATFICFLTASEYFCLKDASCWTEFGGFHEWQKSKQRKSGSQWGWSEMFWSARASSMSLWRIKTNSLKSVLAAHPGLKSDHVKWAW